MSVLWQKVVDIAKGGFATLFQSDVSKNWRWLAIVWLIGTYLMGLYWFWIFFEHGSHTMEFHDWANITAPRLQFLKTAIKEFQLPLHISDPATFHDYTTRYLAVPDTLISPQAILLYWLPIQFFNLVNVWILYSLGFAGLLVLRRKLRLSLVPFTLLALLFNFNGNILAHYSVGHTSWGGYFLFPWFVWLIFRLLEGDRTWRWTLGMAALMSIIWLQGSYHQYVWLLMLLGLIGLLVPRTFWSVVRAGLFTFLLSAFRLLPAILSYGNYSGGFDNGFPTLLAVWEYLVNMAHLNENKFFQMGTGPYIGSWEMTTFVGLVGALFLVYFGVYRGLISRKAPARELALPLGALFLLCTGSFFDPVSRIPIPFFSGERITARMISVVLVFVAIIACERYQRWLDESEPHKAFFAGGSLIAFSMVGMDLWLNMNVWRLSHSIILFEWTLYDKKRWYVANDFSDTIYLWLVFGGLALSVLTLLVLAGLSWRERRR